MFLFKVIFLSIAVIDFLELFHPHRQENRVHEEATDNKVGTNFPRDVAFLAYD